MKRMDGRSDFSKYLRETRVMPPLSNNNERILLVDNASGHDETPETLHALSEIETSTCKLPTNSTHLCQPLDSLIIKCIKGI